MDAKKNYKIIFLSPYPFGKAPSQRLKYEQYYPIFSEEGYHLTTSSFMDDDLWNVIYKKGYFFRKVYGIFKGYCRRVMDLFRLKKYDIVYIHLWATPIGGSLFEYFIARFSKRLVYDIDDMVFTSHSSAANLSYSFLKGKNKPLFLMKASHHIICGTPSLQEVSQVFNYNATVIPTTIDTVRYLPKTDYSLAKTPIIGWSGSHSTAKYLLLLERVLKKRSSEQKFLLKVIGDESFAIQGVEFQSLEWNLEDEIHHLSTFDIGVNPMPNEEWVNGKSGGKTLLYMALGIPTIASASGPNLRIIEDGFNGFLIENEDQWEEAIRKLLNDQELREEIGKNGRKTIEELFSLHANKEKYLNIFKSLTEK